MGRWSKHQVDVVPLSDDFKLAFFWNGRGGWLIKVLFLLVCWSHRTLNEYWPHKNRYLPLVDALNLLIGEENPYSCSPIRNSFRWLGLNSYFSSQSVRLHTWAGPVTEHILGVCFTYGEEPHVYLAAKMSVLNINGTYLSNDWHRNCYWSAIIYRCHEVADKLQLCFACACTPFIIPCP